MNPLSLQTRLFRLFVLCLTVLSFLIDAQAGSRNSVWVKAQGKLNKKGTLVVQTIKKRKRSKSYVLEGIVQREIPEHGTYMLAGIEVIPQPNTRYLYINGEAAPKKEIKAKVRIKAIGTFEQTRFHAHEIRVFQHSKDQDVEVVGRLTWVNTSKDGSKLFRIGPLSLLLKNGLNSLLSSRHNPQPTRLTPVASQFSVQGKVKIMDNSRSTDLAEEELPSSTKRYAKFQTTFRAQFSKHLRGYGRTELFWRDRNQTDMTASLASEGFDFRLRDLYLSLDDPGIRGLHFRIGRQRFRDIRRWLMDRRLDALRLSYEKSRMSFSFAVSRGLGERLTHRDQLHYIATAYLKFSRAFKSSFFVIKEVDERVGRDNPLWLAVQTRGKVSRFLEWWAQGARYSSRQGNISRLGYGVDAGAIIRPLSRGNGPFLSYHFAYGSADDAQTETVRERFRQPRLHLNYYKYGYQKRLFYYGSLLTPELSNLRFQALSLGYVFSKKASLQGIWRTYQQVNASTTVLSNSLGVNPEGLNTDLGDDVELLLHLFPWKPLELSVSGEWFFPGDAFSADVSTFFRLRSELTFYF